MTSAQATSMCTAAQQLSAAGMTIVVSALFVTSRSLDWILNGEQFSYRYPLVMMALVARAVRAALPLFLLTQASPSQIKVLSHHYSDSIHHPSVVGGCQYILSVGATQSFSPEVMVDTKLAGFYSGAGFSNIFSTPSYQTSVVSAYETTLGSTDSGYYTKTGRAFPDVSAQGSLQEVVASGSAELGAYLLS